MIDKAREVAAYRGVAHPSPVDLETPDRATLHVPILALEALLVRDFLAGVIDDPFVLWNAVRGEHAPTMQLRATTFDHGLPRKGSLCHPPPRDGSGALRRDVSPKRQTIGSARRRTTLSGSGTVWSLAGGWWLVVGG